jgi:NAD+ kinase
MSARRAILLVNPSRSEAVAAAGQLSALLLAEGFHLFTSSDVTIDGVANVPLETLLDIEIAIILGGDGTILRGAEATLLRDIPLLGINLGKVGFLAEVSKPAVSEIAASIINKTYVLSLIHI